MQVQNMSLFDLGGRSGSPAATACSDMPPFRCLFFSISLSVDGMHSFTTSPLSCRKSSTSMANDFGGRCYDDGMSFLLM